jgi:hypothetical protein
VRQLLIAAAQEIPGVLSKPPVDVAIESYGDFAINYMVEIFAPNYSLGEQDIRDEMNLRIWYLAQRQGLTIPYPIRQEIPYTPPLVGPEQRRATSLQLLKSTPGFAGLPAERLEGLLVACSVRTYATDEVVLHQQMPLDGLYLIVEGEAELVLPDAGGRLYSLGILLQGEFFGEKCSLLHGRTSDTVVKAATDLQVLVIPTERLQDLLLEAPRLATDLAEVLEIRRLAVQEMLEGALQRRDSSGRSALHAPIDGQPVDGAASGAM